MAPICIVPIVGSMDHNLELKMVCMYLEKRMVLSMSYIVNRETFESFKRPKCLVSSMVSSCFFQQRRYYTVFRLSLIKGVRPSPNATGVPLLIGRRYHSAFYLSCKIRRLILS